MLMLSSGFSYHSGALMNAPLLLCAVLASPGVVLVSTLRHCSTGSNWCAAAPLAHRVGLSDISMAAKTKAKIYCWSLLSCFVPSQRATVVVQTVQMNRAQEETPMFAGRGSPVWKNLHAGITPNKFHCQLRVLSGSTSNVPVHAIVLLKSVMWAS